MPAEIELLAPTAGLEGAFHSLMAEDPNAAGASRFERLGRDYAAFLRALDEEARGVELLPGLVPQNVYWLVRRDASGPVIVGASRLRHTLNATLEDVGGHIGYDVRPSERRRGYGTLLLALTLPRARALGLPRVLLTCYAENVASARIIEKNGGVLASQSVSPRTGTLVSRYWIEL
jgi:predicted acetyltransferase